MSVLLKSLKEGQVIRIANFTNSMVFYASTENEYWDAVTMLRNFGTGWSEVLVNVHS